MSNKPTTKTTTFQGIPLPRTMESYRRRGMPLKDALGELIDNAFDAGATNIAITFNKTDLAIKDDGKGCDNLERMFTIGMSQPIIKDSLGRYGVGFKEAACKFWGTLNVESVCGTTKHIVTVNWDHFVTQTEWVFALDSQPKSSNDVSGTTISFTNTDIERNPPFAKLAEDLGFMYEPAITNGKSIILEQQRSGGKKQHPITPWKLPLMEDSDQDTFEIDGRIARVTIGLVKPDATYKRGFVYRESFRNIAHDCKLLPPDHNGNGICGVIDLVAGWELSTNKNDVVSLCLEELGVQIGIRFKEILDKAKSRSSVAHITSLNTELSNLMTENLNRIIGKEKRTSKKEQSGRILPTGNSARRSLATAVDGIGTSTQRNGKVQSRRVLVDWLEGFPDLKPGSCEYGQTIRVFLNTKHPRLQRCRAENNIDALCIIIEALIANENLKQGGVLPGLEERNDFLDIMASFAKSETSYKP